MKYFTISFAIFYSTESIFDIDLSHNRVDTILIPKGLGGNTAISHLQENPCT